MGGWISHLSDVCPSSSTNCRQIDHQSIVNHLSERRHWECWKIVVQKNIICCFFSVAARKIRVKMCAYYVNLNIQRVWGGYRPWFGCGTVPDVLHPSAWFGGTWNEVAWWNFHHPSLTRGTWSIVESLHPSSCDVVKTQPRSGNPISEHPISERKPWMVEFCKERWGQVPSTNFVLGDPSWVCFSFLSRNAELDERCLAWLRWSEARLPVMNLLHPVMTVNCFGDSVRCLSLRKRRV